VTPKLVTLPTINFANVPAALRNLADLIERGDSPASAHCIVVSEGEDGEIALYGYGQVGTRATEVGLLQMAVIAMATRY